MISFTKGYSNPRHFGEIVEILSPDAELPPTTNVTPTAQATTGPLTAGGVSMLSTQAFFNADNPEPFVERMVVFLGVPVLAFAAMTSRNFITGCLLATLGAGIVYLHTNGSLGQD